MKFLCLTDYHGADEFLSSVPKIVQQEDPDFVFYCGGSMKGEKRLAEFETARRYHGKPDMEGDAIQEEIALDTENLRCFISALAETHKPVYFVPGATDAPESLYFKIVYNYAHIYPNLKPVHEMMNREDQFMVAGFGGDLTFTEDNRDFLLQYSKTWVEFALRRLEYFPGEKILLFHSPPVCRLDRTEEGRCGVLLVNEVIQTVKPSLVICGKSPQGQGVVKLGNTVVVNPGPFSQGHFAVVDYPSLTVQFKNIHESLFE